MPEKGMGLRLNWINETRDGIKLAYLFEQELGMYLHHFHVQAGKYIPVYYSIAQQIIRQNSRLHRMFIEPSKSERIEVISIPTPLRIALQGFYEAQDGEIAVARKAGYVMLVSTGFVGVEENEHRTKMGVSMKEIWNCHITCSAPREELCPYEGIKVERPNTKYVFPAVGQVTGLGGISDALTGRSTWELSGNESYRLQWKRSKNGRGNGKGMRVLQQSRHGNSR
jgi:hypothetical protein